MSYRVTKNEHVIDLDTRSLISVRYKRITKAVNQTFWNSISDTAHSSYAICLRINLDFKGFPGIGKVV